jgi:hypothetical protein
MKHIILIAVFMINLILTSIYMALHLLKIEILSKLDFSCIIIYDIVSLIILSEIVFTKEKES